MSENLFGKALKRFVIDVEDNLNDANYKIMGTYDMLAKSFDTFHNFDFLKKEMENVSFIEYSAALENAKNSLYNRLCEITKLESIFTLDIESVLKTPEWINKLLLEKSNSEKCLERYWGKNLNGVINPMNLPLELPVLLINLIERLFNPLQKYREDLERYCSRSKKSILYKVSKDSGGIAASSFAMSGFRIGIILPFFRVWL